MQQYSVLLQKLAQAYPQVECGLNFGTPFQLLIATILSAQCTDVRVNQVTPKLFADYPDAAHMATLTVEQIQPYIHSCGFYNTKGKNIINTCKILVEKHGGEVPQNRADLEALPGVGRKTANVVLSNAFGQPAIAVDTHVFRVSNRIGIAHANTELETEKQLMQNIPEDLWSIAHHWLIWHGRLVCHARKPNCANCAVATECNYYKTNNGGV